MKLTFVRNIQFSKLVKINGRLKEFNFRKPNHHPHGQFSVDTIDAYGERIIFKMQRSDSGWNIITEGLPTWITEQETSFHDLICKELKWPEEEKVKPKEE